MTLQNAVKFPLLGVINFWNRFKEKARTMCGFEKFSSRVINRGSKAFGSKHLNAPKNPPKLEFQVCRGRRRQLDVGSYAQKILIFLCENVCWHMPIAAGRYKIITKKNKTRTVDGDARRGADSTQLLIVDKISIEIESVRLEPTAEWRMCDHAR